MSSTPFSTSTSRRGFLQIAGIGAFAAVGAGALTGCGSQTALEASGAGSVNLPTFVPFSDLKPDLPGRDEGVPPGFFNYPKDPVRAVADPPLDGDTFSAITNIFGPPPRGRGKNPAWQQIEERLGGKIDISAVSSDDFKTKLNTVIASGDLPDLMLDDGASVPDIVGFLESKCQDLTPFLSGDNVKDYPNLAAIPEIFWKQTVRAGKIYELPIPRSMTGGSGFINKTFFEDAGVSDTSKIADADEYFDIAKELTSSSSNRWALGSTGFGLVPFYHIFNVPNQWAQKNGKLVRYFETEEYLDAIGFAEKLNKAGCFVPGSEGWTKSQMVNAFVSGKVAQIYDGMPAYQNATGYAHTMPKADPDNIPAPFIPFGHDGGEPAVWLDNIVFGTVMMKKKESKEDVRKLLQVANFLASPFGTEEYLLINYGAEEEDYTLDAHGNPEATEQAILDTAVPWKYLTAPQEAIYDPTSQQIVRDLHDAYSKLIPTGIEDPCSTLFSPTESRKGQSLTQEVSDAATGFIAGRKKLQDVKDAVKSWKNGGGDKIREEYQKALDDSAV